MPEKKTFAVLGLGVFGTEVCKVISEKGGKIIAIDNSEEAIEKIKNIVSQAFIINSTDEESLKHAPLSEVDIAIVGIGDNIEASIITTALLKKINVPYIVTRAISPIHAEVLKQVGANEVIHIEIEAGSRLATRLMSPEVFERISLSGDLSIAEILAPKSFYGKSLMELNVRQNFNINIISIKRNSDFADENGNPVRNEFFIIPNPNEKILENDIFWIIGENRNIEKIRTAK